MYLIPNQLQVLLLNYNGNETIPMKFTKAPNWACNEQEDVVYDTEFVQTEGEDEPSFASTSRTFASEAPKVSEASISAAAATREGWETEMQDILIESTTPIIIESGSEEPETRATKRRRTEKGREEHTSRMEKNRTDAQFMHISAINRIPIFVHSTNESTLARKKKEDRTLNYLVKIDKEVEDL
ncbi:hypothetical protein Glove_360g197 [Diversispora epigaea]|uniref:Uncharacterized protein n=1 Tax=Diversispora epigaea TaxID=1348612 RepID=A0A397HEC1_9GLOM|nr:hypothetical protein Glove_360g197 [Diversispora epigaea]